MQGEGSPFLPFHSYDIHPLVDLDPGVLHPVRERILQDWVRQSQHSVFPDDELGFRAEGVEDACKLDSDIAGTDDCDALWLGFEVEETIKLDDLRRGSSQ